MRLTLTENLLKYENYKEQFTRLKSALNNGFNLEAIFIEYAIMEDRNRLIHALLKQQLEHNEIISVGSIYDYLDQSIEEIERIIEQLPPDKPRSWESLNSIFLNAVMR